MKLLFLPGYACTSRSWEPACACLPADHLATLLDWPRSLTPGFHTLDDFSRWLSASFELRSFDAIIGHSMGGRVALAWLASAALPFPRLVLVESYLLSPSAFFRNTVLDPRSVAAATVQQMLHSERAYYSAALASSLRDLDMTPLLERLGSPIHAIYGDRGCGDPARVVAELALPPAAAARLSVAVVPDACHFPMLENPSATASALLAFLSAP